jgi:hypothetical protein
MPPTNKTFWSSVKEYLRLLSAFYAGQTWVGAHP